jgi:hypothetical protein
MQRSKEPLFDSTSTNSRLFVQAPANNSFRVAAKREAIPVNGVIPGLSVPSAVQNWGVGHDTSRERFPLEKELAPGFASEFGLTKPQGTQLLVECAQPPRRPILCRRHSERGSEQSAEMGGIVEPPPIGDLGYGGLGNRSV